MAALGNMFPTSAKVIITELEAVLMTREVQSVEVASTCDGVVLTVFLVDVETEAGRPAGAEPFTLSTENIPVKTNTENNTNNEDTETKINFLACDIQNIYYHIF